MISRRIVDAGEVMGGLRRSQDEATSGGPDDVLPNRWRRPDFARFVKEGRATPEMGAFFMAVHATLAWRPAPVKAEGATPEDWAKAWRRSVDVLRSLWTTQSCADPQEVALVHDAAMKDRFLGTPMEDLARLAGARASRFRHRDGTEEWTPGSPFAFGELAALKAEWLPLMGWPHAGGVTDEAFFAVRTVKEKDGFGYVPVRISGRRIDRAGTGEVHSTSDAALEEARSLQARLVVQSERDAAEGSVGPKALGLRTIRVGPANPRRKGHAKAEDLISHVGLKGVEFGMTVGQKERQAVLDHAYDALYDLCTVLRIPARGASFWGRVGLAFGSRGLGGAIGHFEPSHWVVHMDRSMGAGVLAHEMGHALDAALGVAGGCGEGVMLTEAVALGWDGTDLALLTQEVVKACRQRKDGGKTAFYADAIAMETGRKAYWSQPCEMFARLFECWVHDMLSARGRRNDFLVFPGAGTAERVGDEWKVVTSSYPRGRERRELVELMEEYLSVAVPMMARRLDRPSLAKPQSSSPLRTLGSL
jgi:hypothetical protein